MQSLLVTIVGGVVLAGLLALGGGFLRAGRDVLTHDRFVAEYDEDLASWVSDRTLVLKRELAATTEAMNKKNLFYSSAHANTLALLKEQALHEYRDELRRVHRAVAALEESEGRFHGFWRRGRVFRALTAPQRAEPVLDAWRSTLRVTRAAKSRSSTRRGSTSTTP